MRQLGGEVLTASPPICISRLASDTTMTSRMIVITTGRIRGIYLLTVYFQATVEHARLCPSCISPSGDGSDTH